MAHEYLKDLHTSDAFPYSMLNPDDSRALGWANQREVYGFDDSETWNLNTMFYAWLYERLRMYVDVGGQVINLEFHRFNYKGAEYTQLELIQAILKRIEFYFSDEYDDFDEWDNDYVDEIGEIWALILPAMWW